MWFDVRYIKPHQSCTWARPPLHQTIIKLSSNCLMYASLYLRLCGPLCGYLRLSAPLCDYLRLANCLMYHVCLSLYMRLSVPICAYLCLSALIYTYLRLSAPICA